MCGIAGILGARSDRTGLVRSMMHAIRHRGPDGDGLWEDQHCALGHLRLAIIDLSPAGAQPMPNEDGSVHVTYNGEIYNFVELRKSLEARGHQFRSRTDTEVIVHLYEEHGERCADFLNGMFAFALWDSKKKRLILARDRFGQKPLFYARVGETLVFASEIKALLEIPDLPRTISDEAIDDLLTTQFIAAPRSIYSAIRRLEPGTVLVRELDGRERTHQLWSRPAPRRKVRFEEAVEEVDRLLSASIERQLVADVPLGVFLSGGIDSSLITAGVAKHAPNVEAFCLGFSQRAYDERPFAREAAERFGVRLHEIDLDEQQFAQPERLVDLFDEPFPDVAALPTEALSRAARQRITVALTGDGGDELFGGYEHHVVAYWLSKTQPVGPARRTMARALRRLVPNETKFRSPLRTLGRALDTLAHQDWTGSHLALRATLSAKARSELYTQEFARSVADRDPLANLLPIGARDAAVDGLFDVSRDRVLGDLFLHKTDIASMSVGLESRSPFLDVPLVEFVSTLPLEHFVRGLRGKRILRTLLERRTGPGLARRRKQGFSPPVDEWLRNQLGNQVRDVLLRRGAAVHRVLDGAKLERLYDDHLHRRADNRRLLWTALLLEVFLDRQRVSETTTAHNSSPELRTAQDVVAQARASGPGAAEP
jgi:asparagine synthase (glutamine-hydrolysing)